MQVELHQRFEIEASRIQLYGAKMKALELIEGNDSTSYPLLTTYAAAEVRKSNPGRLEKIQCDRISPSLHHIILCSRGFPLVLKLRGLDSWHVAGLSLGLMVAT